MKKSTCEVSDLIHVCFLPMKHFFAFEHYFLQNNDFQVWGNIVSNSNNKNRVAEERIY